MALSEKDAWLIGNGETGYQRAAALIDWWLARKAAGQLVTHSIRTPRDASISVSAFFDTMTVGNKPATVQGCSWKSRFSPASEAGTPVSMAADIGRKFFQSSKWQHPDGLPGGFDFIPLNYRLSGDGGDGAFDPQTPSVEAGGPELGEIGQKYEWLLCNAIVNDFFRYSPGPRIPAFLLRKLPQMASYVLLHQDYMKPVEPPVEGALADFAFGYSFLPIPVNKTIFGYGPGAFQSAFKQFRWILHSNLDVEIQMLFLVSPRSQKILNLGGFDPVYGTVNLLNALTLNLGFGRWAHNKLDNVQLRVHVYCYQGLLDGMKKVWTDRDWGQPGGDAKSQTTSSGS